MDEDIREIAVKLDRDPRESAEATTFEERAIAGIILFDVMAESMRVGIQMDYPSADAETVEEILVDRLRKMRRDEAKNSDLSL